jgi:hypothetical protein
LGPNQAKEIGVAALIGMQRSLSNSEHPFEQVVGTLFLAGLLNERLARLTDQQIGQLVSDFVSNQLGILDPEMTICEHAALRLFRSSGGNFATKHTQAEGPRDSCPNCGNEMLLHYGIDEPDFLECALLACGYREPA